MVDPFEHIGFLLKKLYCLFMVLQQYFQDLDGALVIHFKSFTKASTAKGFDNPIPPLQEYITATVNAFDLVRIGWFIRMGTFGIQAITHRSYITLYSDCTSQEHYNLQLSFLTVGSCQLIGNFLGYLTL